MLRAAMAGRAMVTAPNALAGQSAVAVLREGGNAVEAMVAAAATIAVVYPHMNGIGGDGFWLIREPGGRLHAIDASGRAGRDANVDLYRDRGLVEIPARGPLAANTVAGAVDGWRVALEVARAGGGSMTVSRLLEDAVHYARAGAPVCESQSRLTADKRGELAAVPGFADVFMPGGRVPPIGERIAQPRLAATLERLVAAGLDDFYRGDLAADIARDLAAAGSPVGGADLASHRAQRVEPLHLQCRGADVYNLPPPTQGLASLLILGIHARLAGSEVESAGWVHGLVESTKQAFEVRDRTVTEPDRLPEPIGPLLEPDRLDALAAGVDPRRAAPWPAPSRCGDTVWMGAIDAEGWAVSYIQSVFWEFGSGVVLDRTGILWQNRGSSFSLASDALNRLSPGHRPFHTLNPALAVLGDGRVMVYGTMGGEGQPQTQAAVLSRYAWAGQDLQRAVSAPRWLLGRTWGEASTTLKLESRFEPAVVDALAGLGHPVEIVGAFDDVMGHAGAVVRHPDGLLEGAADPRGDGHPLGF